MGKITTNEFQRVKVINFIHLVSCQRNLSGHVSAQMALKRRRNQVTIYTLLIFDVSLISQTSSH